MAKPPPSTVDHVVSLAKRRGFVYPCGEIYGGTRSAWDYGPLGVELKDNIKRQWWKSMVQMRDDVVGLDSSVILPRQTWEASGHVDTFTDPLTECQSCHKRFRADHLQEEYAEKKGQVDEPDDDGRPRDAGLPQLRHPRRVDRAAPVLRPAQDLPRRHRGRVRPALPAPRDRAGHLPQLRQRGDQPAGMKPPFGIAQIGKSFRNEITPGNFIFRTREFEQMEMEFFVKPGEDEEWHQYWIDERTSWYVDLGIDPDNLRHYEHPQEKLSHYSKRTVDIEYRFKLRRLGVGRARGHRQPHRLRPDHALASTPAQDLSYFDQANNERYMPYVIEPAAGLSRSLMTFLVDAYHEDEAPNTKGGVDKRTVLRLDPRLAPVKVAVLPLSRNADLSPKAKDLAAELRRRWNVDFDDSGAIGRRYRRQDEIGTPYCVTVDFDTLDDHAVTVRERDTMQQERIRLDGISAWFAGKLLGA